LRRSGMRVRPGKASRSRRICCRGFLPRAIIARRTMCKHANGR
jgi:hypothetical protein